MVKTANEIFRDWETDGVPSSGAHNPIKSDIREWGKTVESEAFPYNTVADMVSSTTNVLGAVVRTLGYYSVGDGGGNIYKVVAAATGTADGGSYINLTGTGLQAKAILTGNVVRAETFGCVDGRECSAQLIAANAYLLSVMGSLPGLTSRTEQGLLTLNSNILIKNQVELGNSSGIYTNIDFRGGWIRVTSGGNLENAPTTPAVTLRGASCEHHLCPIICDKYCSGWLITAVQNSKVFSPMVLDFASNASAYGIKMNNCRGAAIYHPVAVEWTSSWTTQAALSTSYVGTDIVVDGWDFTIYGGHYGWAGKSVWFTANAGYVTWIAMHPYCNKAIITGLNSSGQATTDTTQMVSYTDVRVNPIAVLNDSTASIFLNEPYVDGGYIVDKTGTLQITGGFHFFSDSANANGAITTPYTRIKASAAPGFTANQFRSSFGFFDTDYTTLNTYSAAWASGINGLSSGGPLPFVGRQFQMYFTSAFTDTPNVEEVSRSVSPIRHRYSFADGAYIDELYEDGQAGTKTVFARRLTVDGTTSGQASTYLVLGNANHGFRLDSDDLDLNFLMANTARWKIDNTAYAFQPAVDNAYNLGSATLRVKTVYASTGTINTSDARCKVDVAPISEAALDAWGDVGWAQFRFTDAVAEKGDEARLHTGAIAQAVKAAFEAHGLDAMAYGLLCYDEWGASPEVTEERQVVVTPAVINGDEIVTPAVYRTENVVIKPAVEAGNRYGIRYEEALCMEAAYQRRRADRIESRIAVLESKLLNAS